MFVYSAHLRQAFDNEFLGQIISITRSNLYTEVVSTLKDIQIMTSSNIYVC